MLKLSQKTQLKLSIPISSPKVIFKKWLRFNFEEKTLVIPVSMLPLDDSSENLSDMNKKLSEIIEEQTRQSEALAKSMVDIKNGIEVRPFLIIGHFEKEGHFEKKRSVQKPFFRI